LEEPLLFNNPGVSLETPYAAVLKTKWAQQRASHVALILLFCLFITGPFAIATVLLRQVSSVSIFGIILFAPLIEEFAKIAVPLIILERFPWRWTRGIQLVFVCAASGLIFSVIENLLYQYVYIKDPTPDILAWRWTICTLLHVGCSTIASLGLYRIWRNTRQHYTRPDASLLIPYVAIAIALHGAYNTLAITLSALKIL